MRIDPRCVLLLALAAGGCGRSSEVQSGQIPAPLTEEQKEEMDAFSQDVQAEEGGTIRPSTGGN